MLFIISNANMTNLGWYIVLLNLCGKILISWTDKEYHIVDIQSQILIKRYLVYIAKDTKKWSKCRIWCKSTINLILSIVNYKRIHDVIRNSFVLLASVVNCFAVQRCNETTKLFSLVYLDNEQCASFDCFSLSKTCYLQTTTTKKASIQKQQTTISWPPR